MGYKIDFSDKAKGDLKTFKKAGDQAIVRKIFKLIQDIEKSPFVGIGKPEALKHDLSGFWSRRINREHRIVYKIQEGKEIIEVHSLKGHY